MLKKASEPRATPAGIKVPPQTYQLNSSLETKRSGNALKTVTESEIESVEVLDGPVEQVSPEALHEAWKKFAEEHVAEGPRSLYTTLLAEIPEIEANNIRFKIVNSIQEKDLSEVKAELLDYLRKQLNNVALTLTVELLKEEGIKKEFLSERQKYDRMAEKNPLLEELRKRLDLDLT